MALRLVFMGTPDFSVPTLKALFEAGHEIVACYSQPPRPAGRRGLELKKSPVHEWAEAHNIEVRTPLSLKGKEEQENFSSLEADLAIVVAYGLLLPKAILDAPKFGCFNGHASLLPRWRGAAPIQRAIMTGDQETGVMIMKMDEGLDTGPFCAERRIKLDDQTKASQLHDELSALCASLMVETVARLEDKGLEFSPQPDEGVTYAHKISKQEARLDWGQKAIDIHRTIMGLSPFPGAWCELSVDGKAQRLKILESAFEEGTGQPGEILDERMLIACGENAIRPLVLQGAGSKAMPLDQFLNGTVPAIGDILT